MTPKYTFDDCTAIILAGGTASRMGRDKRFLKIGSENLLEHHVRVLSKHFSAVMISANDSEKLKRFGLPIIRDEHPGRGPLEGLTSALAASETERNFVVAIDIPRIDLKLLQGMWKKVHQTSVVVPVTVDGNLEPLYAFYEKSCVPTFRRLIREGELAIYRALSQCSVFHYPLSGHVKLSNLNRPEDYASYLESKNDAE